VSRVSGRSALILAKFYLSCAYGVRTAACAESGKRAAYSCVAGLRASNSVEAMDYETLGSAARNVVESTDDSSPATAITGGVVKELQ